MGPAFGRTELRSKPASPESRNDIAVAQVISAKPKQLWKALLKLEKESPGRYQTAANLGTCYENGSAKP